jgi:hypothetical protein
MATFSLYFFFHIIPLLILIGLPLWFIVYPMLWAFDKWENALSK